MQVANYFVQNLDTKLLKSMFTNECGITTNLTKKTHRFPSKQKLNYVKLGIQAAGSGCFASCVVRIYDIKAIRPPYRTRQVYYGLIVHPTHEKLGRLPGAFMTQIDEGRSARGRL